MSSTGQEFVRIFHSTDLSVGSEAAFDHALRLAVAARGHLYIVHADRSSQGRAAGWTAFPGVRSSLIRWGLLPVGAVPADVRERAGVQVTKVEVHDRRPIDGVLRFMIEHPGDLLVLATHARKGMSYLLRGSIAEALARGAVVPTLFFPIGCQGFVDHRTGAAQLRNILLPATVSAPIGGIAQVALRLADQIGCTEALLHVLQARPAEANPPMVVDVAHEPRLRIRQAESVSIEAILAEAENVKADLIVMRTVRRKGLPDHLRGSMTEQVLHQAKRPLLAVPAN